ncbi:polysaccharide deacetylase family protein [Actinocorallia sp. A-T 12471]|uniref:polysaccharide deacetylase family protein n=1 Tax=Actinocorallia sp. A-T 12471 TaxID=3089813 RepID=UPI0029CC48ED|nr:polysaccharide deacetylase family protein [Actinocorallia sp. A-T 12471]MDX6743003.1 polysaccharide deacetylase family protein [Actinocorallia sp. A-T 12471]
MPTLHKFAVLVLGAALLFGLLLAPQEQDADEVVAKPSKAGAAAEPAGHTATPTAKPTPTKTTPPPPQPATAAAAAAKANELGQVPVIMYHRIIKKPFSSIDRTPDELRKELESLAKANYVPITAADFVRGNIDIPAGSHPVVLTFDDGNPTQFALDASGNPVPETAVGVLFDVASRYPTFRPVATFYVNKDPFQLGEEANPGVAWLVQHGFEIGNHTQTHPNLAGMSRKNVEAEIAKNESVVEKISGSRSVTFAYPFGNPPRSKAKDNAFVAKGSTWEFKGIFLAGWNPSVSVFAKDFDPTRISRIRSEDKIKEDGCDKFCSTAWLEWLEKNPDQRFTSDGDKNTVTAPSSVIGDLAPDWAAQGRFYQPADIPG